MKRPFHCLTFGAALLILAAGCKKAQDQSNVLTTGTKALPTSIVTGFPIADPSGRVIAFDDDDGTGASNLLCYDLFSGSVNVVHVNGGTLTNVWPQTTGFMIDNTTNSQFRIDQASWDNAATDNYNEVGGVHVTALDLDGSGHLDHIVVYIPGKGVAMILKPSTITPGWWHMVWPTSGGTYSTSGIGGYDLHGPTDKIIAWGITSLAKNDLVCYRPGYGFLWILQNQSSNPETPNWVGVLKKSDGLGGANMSNVNDQLIAVENLYTIFPQMDLLAYRPGSGDVWYLSRTENTVAFSQMYASSAGLPGAPLNAIQDRIMPFGVFDDPSGSGLDFWLVCFTPGAGANTEYLDHIETNAGGSPAVAEGALFSSTLNYPLDLNPYGSPVTYEGDKMVAIQGANGYCALVCYQNGTGLAQIYQQASTDAPNGQSVFTQVY